MHQWWEALGQLYRMLQDADALGLSREARRRLIVAVAALDSALLNCATVDCPIRSAVSEEASPAVAAQKEAERTLDSCRNCRWWGHHQPVGPEEGVCSLTRTEGAEPHAVPVTAVNTLAHAAALDPRVGAILVTRISYVCSQWAPV